MKNKFLNFINEKQAELEGTVLNYEQECSLIGTHPLTSRQPPSFHAMLCVLERFIPLTSRGEIIHTAISSAFETFASQYDKFEESGAADYYRLFSIAYTIKSAKDSDENYSGFTSSAENKARAELLLASIRADEPYDEIIQDFSDLLSLFPTDSKE